MSGYGKFCPVAKGAEVFAERWTPLILRDILYGSHRFSELQSAIPQISQSVLTQRLRSLERDGVLERRRAAGGRGWEYYLTPSGEELGQVVEVLGAWGYRWATPRLTSADVDPRGLMWAIYRAIIVDALPARRVVVQFAFSDHPRQLWWLVLKRPETDLCFRDEGFEVDIYVTADSLALAQVYLGNLELAQAMRQGLIHFEGPRDLVRQFPGWIRTSHFARHKHRSIAGPRHSGERVDQSSLPGESTAVS